MASVVGELRVFVKVGDTGGNALQKRVSNLTVLSINLMWMPYRNNRLVFTLMLRTPCLARRDTNLALFSALACSWDKKHACTAFFVRG